MKTWHRKLLWAGFGALGLLLLLLASVRWRYGGGHADFPDLTSSPLLHREALEPVASLDLPPGNVAVTAGGRIFFSLHPEAHPRIRIAELKQGVPVPYPSAAFQARREGEPFFDNVISLRVDRQERLWTLDNGNHGLGQPCLLAFDLPSGRLVHRYDFPSELAGLGSHLNDFQVDPEGKRIYIADASIFRQSPAILVYDVERGSCRRLLESHPSVLPDPYVPLVQGRTMLVFGVFAIRPGVDSIALDKKGEWLYYGAVTARHLYRVRAADLSEASVDPRELERKVEAFADKTMSDGISMDLDGNVYLTDVEHSAIVRLGPDGRLATLVKDERLRWPDGLSFGPEGWLYVTCSALHQVIGRTAAQVRARAPFQIYRFRPGALGVPGH